MSLKQLLCILVAWAVLGTSQAQQAVTVTDDEGATVTLKQPAQRIAALAPHAAELVAAAGMEQRIIATVLHADFPVSVLKVQRVGDAFTVNVESLLATKPDLVVLWSGGGNPVQLQKLKSLGIPVYQSNPRTLNDIAVSLRKLGVLGGTQGTANTAANQFEQYIATLRQQYANKAPVKVFYQLWDAPVMTINRSHVLNDIMALCGGHNVFAQLPVITPTLDREAVIAAAPQVMLGGTKFEGPPSQSNTLYAQKLERTFGIWKPFKQIPAIAHQQLYLVDADATARMGPRMARGAHYICSAIDKARAHYAK